MEESVTLKLRRYEALLDEARRVDTLEKENAELRKELAAVQKKLEERRLHEVGIGNTMGNPKIVESSEEFKNKLVVEYPESIMLCDKDNPEKKVVFNSKGIHLYEGDTLTSFKSI